VHVFLFYHVTIRCDGAKDCQDGSDEAGCSGSHEVPEIVTLRPNKETCSIDHWRCHSGKLKLSFISTFPYVH